MPTRKRKITAAQKQAAEFKHRLKAVRAYVAGFDAKTLDKLRASKPRTVKAKAARAAKLAKVNATFRKLKPYLTRSHKRVKVATVRVEQVADYVGMRRIKGLRAVPVPTTRPGKLKVKFDRKGKLSVEAGKDYREVLYKFPRAPRNRRGPGGQFITRSEDMVMMLEKMLPTMKAGYYVLATRHQFLIPFSAERGALVSNLKRFLHAYQTDTEFLKLLYGFKWLAHTYEAAQRRRDSMLSARARAKLERQQSRAEREAREIGHKLKRRRITKRARATGRA